MTSVKARHHFAIGLFVVLGIAASAGSSIAQFSKAVVIMKGTVLTEETGRTIPVQLSVRAVGDTASEITASRPNSQTGNYLVVLKPGKKYWIHLSGATIMTKDTLIEVPQSDHTIQVVHDFVVTPLETELTSAIQDSQFAKKQ